MKSGLILLFLIKILTEYEEQITLHWNFEVATNVIRSLLELSTAQLTVSYFNLKLIANDNDDNKFVDCAFAANADFIVTNDRHFDVLKDIGFPFIKVVNLTEFEELLIERKVI